MLLRDATDKAAVDLFLRSLSFPYPRDIGGIPGDFAGLTEPHQEDHIALLVHEFEHLTSLLYPVGTVFSALGLRLVDLRNDMLRGLSSWRDELLEVSKQESPPPLLQDVEVVSAAYRCAEFSTLTLTVIEIMTPLLEGLAVLSEMELDYSERQDSSYSQLMATALEFTFYEHRLIVEKSTFAAEIFDPSRINENLFKFWTDLQARVEGQLTAARASRRMDLVDRLFFDVRDSERARAAEPYFAGYLYLRRLLQQWRRVLPTLELQDFFNLAVSWVCKVMPLSVLELFSLKDFEGKRAATLLPSAGGALLETALALDRDQLELLGQQGLLRWDWHEKNLVPAGADIVDEDPNEDFPVLRSVIPEILYHVFDIRGTADVRLRDIHKNIYSLEHCKFLSKAGARAVVVVGVDRDQKSVLLADLEKLKRISSSDSAGSPTGGVTFFKFEENQLDLFLDMVAANGEIPPIRLGEAPYRMNVMPHPILVTLETYFLFWPSGLPTKGKDDTIPLTFIRLLAVDEKRVSCRRLTPSIGQKSWLC